MANRYQDALTQQLTGGSRTRRQQAPGFQAPVDPGTTPIEVNGTPTGDWRTDPNQSPPQTFPDAGPSAPAPAGGGGGSLMDILGKYQYGAKGLADAEQELAGAGYQMQKGGAGVRGRLKAANGDIIDVIDQNEGNDWWNNQTGQNWNINNRGQEGLDAGGWSFGGPSSDMVTPTPFPMPAPKDVSEMPVPTAGPDDQSPYLAALLAQLGL